MNKKNNDQMQVAYEVMVGDGHPRFFLDLEKVGPWTSFLKQEYKTLYRNDLEVGVSIRAIFFETVPEELKKAIELERLIDDDVYNVIDNNMIYAIDMVW